MRKFLVLFVIAIAVLLVVPPLWFTLSPAESPDLPPAGRQVEIGGGQPIHVLEQGAGPPVVLLHGLPGTAYDWQLLSKELADRGFRAIAIDRAGYGHSDPRPADTRHTVERNAEELIATLDALGLDRVSLVGWSYGGVVAMFAGEDHPTRFDHLVLVGTGGPDSAEARPPEPPGFMRFLYSDPVLAWRSRVPPVGRALIEAISRTAYSDQPMPAWWLPLVQANFARRATLLTYRGEMFTIEGEFDPSAIRIPTLILHGDDDRLAPVAIANYLGGVIPEAKLQIVPGGSHMLPVVEARVVADAIAAFVR